MQHAILSVLCAAAFAGAPANAAELLGETPDTTLTLAAPTLAAPTLTVFDAGSLPAGNRAAYSALITREADRRGMPSALAHAVATIESGWDPNARGTSGEVGLMQIMPATAAMLGFRGTNEQLADPATNIRLGVQYLSAAWVLAGGEPCTALMKYRAGHGETMMSARSVQYCQRAGRYLTSVNSPLAARANVSASTIRLPDGLDGLNQNLAPRPFAPPTLLTSDEWVRLRTGHRTAEDSERFWAARRQQLVAMRAQRETLFATRLTLTRPVHLATHQPAVGPAAATARRYALARAHRHTHFALRLPRHISGGTGADLVSEWFPGS